MLLLIKHADGAKGQPSNSSRYILGFSRFLYLSIFSFFSCMLARSFVFTHKHTSVHDKADSELFSYEKRGTFPLSAASCSIIFFFFFHLFLFVCVCIFIVFQGRMQCYVVPLLPISLFVLLTVCLPSRASSVCVCMVVLLFVCRARTSSSTEQAGVCVCTCVESSVIRIWPLQHANGVPLMPTKLIAAPSPTNERTNERMDSFKHQARVQMYVCFGPTRFRCMHFTTSHTFCSRSPHVSRSKSKFLLCFS